MRLQGKCDNQISAIKHRPEDTDNCGKCELNHKNGNCLARGNTCSACGRKNHWARMCHNKRLKKKMDRQPQTNRTTKPKKFTPVQYAHKNLQNSINVQDQVADELEKMSFCSMEDRGKKCSRTEAFASLDIILPNRKGVHELKIKVDKGAEGNTLPLLPFQQMFPEHVDRNGRSRPVTARKESAVLTAYNGSSISHSTDPYKFIVPTRVNGGS